MKIDWFRIFIALLGAGLFLLVFLKYGVWFEVPNGLPELVVTVCAIFAGFQMGLFSALYGINNSNFRNAIIKNRGIIPLRQVRIFN